MKKLIGLAIIIVIVAINPLYGQLYRMWFGDDYDYTQDEAAMRATIEGTWTLTPEHGAPIQFTAMEVGRHVPREGLVRAAGACGEHSFVHTAGACSDVNRLELAIASKELVVDRGAFIAPAAQYEYGELELEHGGDVVLHARVAPDGKVLAVAYIVGGKSVPATLVRM